MTRSGSSETRAADRAAGRAAAAEGAAAAERAAERAAAIEALREEIVECRRCPRLVEWRERVAREKVLRYRDEPYWGRPAPGFGDPDARLLIVGLGARCARCEPDRARLHR